MTTVPETSARPAGAEPARVAAVMRRLIRDYIANQWSILIGAVICMVITAAASGTIPLLIKYTTRYIFVLKQPEMLWPITLAVIAIMTVRAASWFGQKTLIDTVGERVVAACHARHVRQSDGTRSGLAEHSAFGAVRLRLHLRHDADARCRRARRFRDGAGDDATRHLRRRDVLSGLAARPDLRAGAAGNRLGNGAHRRVAAPRCDPRHGADRRALDGADRGAGRTAHRQGVRPGALHLRTCPCAHRTSIEDIAESSPPPRRRGSVDRYLRRPRPLRDDLLRRLSDLAR